MKQITTLLIAMLFSSVCFADSLSVHNTIVIPDSLLIKSVAVGAIKHPFWDNLPSIIASAISGFLSIIALSVAYINTKNTIKAQNENFAKQLKSQEENLERQLKTQLETTVEKEWINSIQQHLSSVMHLGHIYVLHKKELQLIPSDKKVEREEKEKNALSSILEFLSRIYSLKLLLNKEEKPFQYELLKAIDLLGDEVNKHEQGEFYKIDELNEGIIIAAHKLFNSEVVSNQGKKNTY